MNCLQEKENPWGLGLTLSGRTYPFLALSNLITRASAYPLLVHTKIVCWIWIDVFEGLDVIQLHASFHNHLIRFVQKIIIRDKDIFLAFA
jgi:hypothetical protein